VSRRPAPATAPPADLDLHAATQSSQHDGCLVCGAGNPAGLQLCFRPTGEGGVATRFTAGPALAGYPGLLHGGLICALVDGAMTNCLFARGVTAVTAELNVRYLEGVPVERDLEITAGCLRARGHLFVLQAEIRLDGRTVVRATGKFIDKGRQRPVD